MAGYAAQFGSNFSPTSPTEQDPMINLTSTVYFYVGPYTAYSGIPNPLPPANAGGDTSFPKLTDSNSNEITGNTYVSDGKTYISYEITSTRTINISHDLKNVDIIIVAGGGGGNGRVAGHGGGAGGVVVGTGINSITSGEHTIAVGEGGAGGTLASSWIAESGANSEAFGYIAIGGGRGGGTNTDGANGGSGAGNDHKDFDYYGRSVGYHSDTGTFEFTGGTANYNNDSSTYPNVMIYGYNGGGSSQNAWNGSSAGGGGAGGVGGTGNNITFHSGAGGVGITNNFLNGVDKYYGGGGGGGNLHVGYNEGAGGNGGGGAGGDVPNSGTFSNAGVSGTPNTGGGGGGASAINSPNNYTNGGNGGSGVVILRFVLDENKVEDTGESPPTPENDDYPSPLFSFDMGKDGNILFGGSVAEDESITLDGSTYKPLQIEGPDGSQTGMHFIGDKSILAIARNGKGIPITTSWTADCYINPGASSGSNNWKTLIGSFDTHTHWFVIRNNQDNVSIGYFDLPGSPRGFNDSGYDLPLTGWYRFTVSADGSNTYFYLNGNDSPVAQIDSVIDTPSHMDMYAFGNREGLRDQPWGYLSAFRLYDQNYLPSEILDPITPRESIPPEYENEPEAEAEAEAESVPQPEAEHEAEEEAEDVTPTYPKLLDESGEELQYNTYEENGKTYRSWSFKNTGTTNITIDANIQKADILVGAGGGGGYSHRAGLYGGAGGGGIVRTEGEGIEIPLGNFELGVGAGGRAGPHTEAEYTAFLQKNPPAGAGHNETNASPPLHAVVYDQVWRTNNGGLNGGDSWIEQLDPNSNFKFKAAGGAGAFGPYVVAAGGSTNGATKMSISLGGDKPIGHLPDGINTFEFTNGKKNYGNDPINFPNVYVLGNEGGFDRTITYGWCGSGGGGAGGPGGTCGGTPNTNGDGNSVGGDGGLGIINRFETGEIKYLGAGGCGTAGSAEFGPNHGTVPPGGATPGNDAADNSCAGGAGQLISSHPGSNRNYSSAGGSGIIIIRYAEEDNVIQTTDSTDQNTDSTEQTNEETFNTLSAYDESIYISKGNLINYPSFNFIIILMDNIKN